MLIKTYFFSLLLFLVLVLTSCSGEYDVSVEQYNSNECIIVDSNAIYIPHPNGVVLSVENRLFLSPVDMVFSRVNESIFRSSFETTHNSGVMDVYRLEQLRYGDWVLRELYSIDSANIRWPEVAFGSDEYFYLAIVVNENGNEELQIIRLNSNIPRSAHGIDTRREMVTIAERSQVTYVNLFYADGYLILFEPHYANDVFTYTITKINIATNLSDVIMQKSYSMVTGVGDVIANIFAENSSIFLYRVMYANDGTKYFLIDEYNFYGELQSTYSLDLENFLFMHEVDDEDSVLRIVKIANYFLLQTVHNRIIIFRMENGSLEKLETPSSFQKLGATTIVNPPHSAAKDMIYFWNMIENHLYIYCFFENVFTLVEISLMDEELLPYLLGWLHDIQSDDEGNLFIQIRIDYEAYLLYREEASDEHSPYGAARFMPNDSVFYKVNATELMRFIGR